MQLVLIVVGLYMAAMLAIGFIFSKKSDDATNYFLSGRSLPSFVLIFTFAATWIGASSTLGKSGLAYTSGLSAISPTIGAFIAFFIFTFFAGRIRRIGAEHNISSIPELFERRFGRTTSLIAALVIAYTLIGTTGTQLIAFSKVLEHIFNPYGISYEQALDLYRRANKAGKPRLFVHQQRRLEAAFNAVRAAMDSGKLGRIFEVNTSQNSFQHRDDWQTISEFGGGQLLNWGPHLVDQALRFAGGDYEEMFSDIRHVVAAGDCEDVVHATMRGVNGRMVEIQISGASALKLPEYIVYGSRGALIDNNDGKFHIRYVDPSFELPRPVASIETPAGAKFGPDIEVPFVEEDTEWDNYPLDHTWTYLYEAIREGKEYPVSNEDALKVMQTLCEIRANGKHSEF